MKIPIGMRKFYLTIFFGLLYSGTLIGLQALGAVVDGYLAGGIGVGFGTIYAGSMHGYSKEYKNNKNMFGKNMSVTETGIKIGNQ